MFGTTRQIPSQLKQLYGRPVSEASSSSSAVFICFYLQNTLISFDKVHF